MYGRMKKMFLIEPAEHRKEYSNRLDKEMNEILLDSKISESEKLSRYLAVLRRYIISKQIATNPAKSDNQEEMTTIIPSPSSSITTTTKTPAKKKLTISKTAATTIPPEHQEATT